ncbi:MAG: DUF4127 family protein, partial [Armatimonadetes bacterium]|nr:DUF4127 family protein [Armatimonadota bacterium]NIO76437.1 DUF4127 family protein [Armatimonadota bacterium]NIO98157.1 DUF4127 family protein [Armatimonadota bacterium]
MDMLCFGGLWASRSTSVPLELAQRRLKNVRALKERNPDLPIYGFNIIMRLSITQDSEEGVSHWRDVALFSQLSYRVEELGQSRWEEALDAVRRRLPSEILDSYLAARERNHIINQETVRLAADGILESAIVCQEDTAPIGLHIPEQEALKALVKQLSVRDRVFIHAGADEATLTLLARAANKMGEWEPGVAVIYASQEGADRVALYEDQPIGENVLGHVIASGAKLARNPAQADLVLLVHTPTGPQREVVRRDAQTDKRSRPQAKRLVRRAAALLKKGARVSVVDLAYCNGSDPILASALADAGILPALAAFAGWNTAGNSIGTALAQGLLVGLAEKRPPRPSHHSSLSRNLNFLFARLGDDFLYQSKVRQEANDWVRSIGLTPVFLGEIRGRTERLIRRRLKEEAQKLFRDGFEGRRIGAHRITRLKKLGVRLPWPRTFEIEVNP